MAERPGSTRPPVKHRIVLMPQAYRRMQRALSARWTFSRLSWAFRGKAETLVIPNLDAGFFANYFLALAAYRICQHNRRNLRLDFDTGTYFDRRRPESSWWSYYHETDRYPFAGSSWPLASTEYTVTSPHLLARIARLGTRFDRQVLHQCASAMRIRHDILAQVDAFCAEKMARFFTIGIHYRGTDKVSGPLKESMRIDYEQVTEILDRLVEIPFRLFVATDEQDFLALLRARHGDRVLSIDAVRSANHEPVHLCVTGAASSNLGREALLDALLLARTSFLLRCDSNLSLASLFFNPRLATTNLSDAFRPVGEGLSPRVLLGDPDTIANRIVRTYSGAHP